LRNFGGLVINEWLKLSKKKTFFIPYAIMLAFVALFTYATHSMDPGGDGSALEFAAGMMTVGVAGQILPFIAIIFTASIVSQEYRFGTIKFLLIRSHSRSKILASKYVVALMATLSLIAAVLVFSFGAGFILYGMNAGESVWGAIGENIVYLIVYSIVYVTMTFMIGVLTKSSGVTIGISMFIIMIANLVTMLLSRYSFVKYILTSNVDLSMYANGSEPPIGGLTMPFSIAVLVAYMAIFLLASFVTFRKRDVS